MAACEGAGLVRPHRDGDGDTWGLGRCHLPGRRRAGRSWMARVGRAADADGPGPDRVKRAQLRGRLCEQAPHGVHGAAGHNAELGGRKRSRAGFFNREQRVHQPGLSGRFSHAGCIGRSASDSQGQAAKPAKSSGQLPRVRRPGCPATLGASTLLLGGLLPPLRPVGGHALRYRLLLLGRHGPALPFWLGLGFALGDGGLLPRGAPRRRACRRCGRSKHLLDVGQRLDLGLEAVYFTLAVSNCLCDVTHWSWRLLACPQDVKLSWGGPKLRN